MARFIGYVQGQTGEVSRLGSPRSGITAQAQGWNVGIRVDGHANGDDDVFDVYLTSGSNGGNRAHLGRVAMVDGSPVFTLTNRFKAEMVGPTPVATVSL